MTALGFMQSNGDNVHWWLPIFFYLDYGHSRKVFVFFLQQKSQVKSTFESFKNLIENETDKKIKILRTGNGKEYVNYNLKSFVDMHGIRHETTVQYTPEQNGLAERMNRSIVEKARSMLINANLPTSFWDEATSTTVHLINRSPAAAQGKVTS